MKTACDWSKAVSEGLSLSMKICNDAKSVELGEALLAAGLSAVYQSIQGAQLSQKICSSTDPDLSISSRGRINHSSSKTLRM